jgi:hypothetical protein
MAEGGRLGLSLIGWRPFRGGDRVEGKERSLHGFVVAWTFVRGGVRRRCSRGDVGFVEILGSGF